MDVRNVREGDEWFSVLQSTEKTQTAVMTLAPGQSSSEQPERHTLSDQVLLVLEGELVAEVDGRSRTLEKVRYSDDPSRNAPQAAQQD